MSAVIDQDHEPLERWYGMRDAEIAVVWDAHLGGHPVSLLGFESKPLPRLGFVPVYGPDQWTGGTLFPLASKKVARAINAASGNRPAGHPRQPLGIRRLAGVDASLQLEYGAEIGRAMVRFKGPIVFCVVSRYHGGAFVVFSNAQRHHGSAALEGAHASVIGGARRRGRSSPGRSTSAPAADPGSPSWRRRSTRRRAAGGRGSASSWPNDAAVRPEKLGEVAAEFDTIHSVERACEVGSVAPIIPAARDRPALIDAVERGMRRTLERPLQEAEPS